MAPVHYPEWVGIDSGLALVPIFRGYHVAAQEVKTIIGAWVVLSLARLAAPSHSHWRLFVCHCSSTTLAISGTTASLWSFPFHHRVPSRAQTWWFKKKIAFIIIKEKEECLRECPSSTATIVTPQIIGSFHPILCFIRRLPVYRKCNA